MKASVAMTSFSLMCCAMAGGHGTHDERVELYAEKLKRDPGDVNSRHELALAHVENGDWCLALAELAIADRITKPGSGLDFSVTRARALVLGGRPDGARVVLDAFLEKSPGHAPALLERARIYDTLKMPEESLADYRNALRLTVNPERDLFLEIAGKLAGQHADDEAILVIQKGIASKGAVPSLVLKAVDLEIAAGRYDDALKRVDSMARLMPRPEPWMAKRASVLARAGRLEESRHEWEGLVKRIDGLPAPERGSVAMTTLSKGARLALAALSTPPAGNPARAAN